MKVCLFADAQSVHIQQLAPRLAASGAKVHVVTHKPAEVPGCSVERFSVPKAGLNNLRRWEGRHRAYLGSFFRRFDVVNVQFLQGWGFCSAGQDCQSVMGSDGCLVATAWGSDIVDPPGETPASPDLIRSRTAVLRTASAVTACGPSFARVVEHFAAFDPGSVEVVPFGVDLGIFSHQSRKRELTRRPCIGFFKGFRPVYGASRFVRAIPHILRKVPTARFEMIGDGKELQHCKDAADALGVGDAVTWRPRMQLSELPRYLRDWDVSVIPSVHEAFGVAALESAAMGVPVVASDVCGLRDTVRNGETGLLVNARRPSAIGEAVARLISDRRLLARMADCGRQMVERDYQWDELIGDWIKLYEKARERACVMV